MKCFGLNYGKFSILRVNFPDRIICLKNELENLQSLKSFVLVEWSSVYMLDLIRRNIPKIELNTQFLRTIRMVEKFFMWVYKSDKSCFPIKMLVFVTPKFSCLFLIPNFRNIVVFVLSFKKNNKWVPTKKFFTKSKFLFLFLLYV